MSGIATAAVAGAYITSEGNKDAAETAAGARPKFAKPLVRPINRQLSRLDDTTVPSFQGDRVADFTGDQESAFGLSGALADRLGGLGELSGRGFENFAGGGSDNPFLEDAIAGMRESSFRDLSRNQLPAVRNNAIASGGIGGSRQGIAEGLALSDLNRDLVNREGSMRQNQFNQDLSNQLQALINQGQILGGVTQGQDLLFRSGAMQQDQAQREIGAERERFDEQNIDQFERDQQLLSILLGTPATRAPIPNQANELVSGLGAATLVAQMQNTRQPTNAQTQPSGGGTGGTFDFVPNQNGMVGGF